MLLKLKQIKIFHISYQMFFENTGCSHLVHLMETVPTKLLVLSHLHGTAPTQEPPMGLRLHGTAPTQVLPVSHLYGTVATQVPQQAMVFTLPTATGVSQMQK